MRRTNRIDNSGRFTSRYREVIDCAKPLDFGTARDDLVLRQVTLMPDGVDEIAVSFVTNGGTMNVLASPEYLRCLARKFMAVATGHGRQEPSGRGVEE